MSTTSRPDFGTSIYLGGNVVCPKLHTRGCGKPHCFHRVTMIHGMCHCLTDAGCGHGAVARNPSYVVAVCQPTTTRTSQIEVRFNHGTSPAAVIPEDYHDQS